MRNCIRAAGVVGVLGIGLHALAGPQPGAPQKSPMSKDKARSALARAARQFTENAGQWDQNATFVSRSRGIDLWVTHTGATFDFNQSTGKNRVGQVVRMTFAGGAKNLASTGSDVSDGKYRFVFGRAGTKHTARRYGSVTQHGVYPGVDVRYYVDGSDPRYDFVVQPGADPNRIGMQLSGATGIKVDPKEIVMGTCLGAVRHTKLVAYQLIDGHKSAVAAKFAQRPDGSVGFNLGSFDHSKPLVIDPLVYGSYYGGDQGIDEVRSVVSDQDGGVYLVGSTQAFKFPALQGPYSFNLNGVKDAFVAKLRGDVYANVYATFLGGSQSERAEFAQLDPFGNLWIAGRTSSIDFPGNTRPNVEFLQLDEPPVNPTSFPNGGTFMLTHGFDTSGQLPFNANATQVFNALNGMPSLNGLVQSVTKVGSGLPGTRNQPGSMRIQLDPSITDTVGVISTYLDSTGNGDRPNGNPFDPTANNDQRPSIPDVNVGLEGRYLMRNVGPFNTILQKGSTVTHAPGNPQLLPPKYGSEAVATFADETFTISFWNPAVAGGPFVEGTTDPLAWNATGAQIQTALNALPNLLGGTFTVTGATANVPGNIQITFTPSGATAAVSLNDNVLYMRYTDQNLYPRPSFTATELDQALPKQIFVTRWARTPDGLLDPLPTQTLIFGGDFDETISGFAVQQKDNPVQGEPVVFGFAGNTDSVLPEATGTAKGAYIARYQYTSAGFQKISVKYVGESAPLLMGGFALDHDGNGYITGQVIFGGNTNNPSGQGIFTTLNSTWENSTKLRLSDVFVRKYSPDNTMLYSGLIGGNDEDWTGGFDWTIDGDIDTVGSAIAVDNQGNAYVTGVTTSFNFPRTPNVFGETFVTRPAATIFVTKISSDASRLVYSTSLNTSMDLYNGRNTAKLVGVGLDTLPAPVTPAGIGVDFSGDAYITGNGHPMSVTFPDEHGATAGNPNEPDGTALPGGIPLQNPLDPTWESPASPEFPTSEGWITVLNPTGTALLYSSYAGGRNEEQVMGPYVDRFGDVWVMGWIVTHRTYVRGTKVYDSASSLPAALITPLAFKSIPDPLNSLGVNMVYGGYESSEAWGQIQTSPLTVRTSYAMDGFVNKLRVGTPSVATITFAPATIPGGLGASSTATITLSAPAPAGGAPITVDLDTTNSASFDPTVNVGSVALTIPAGQTSITQVIFSKPVTTNSAVQVKATYLGSFQIRQLNVVPWLLNDAVTPNTLVGGNVTSGRVTLAAVAPASGITVSLTTDQPKLITFPAGGTVTVPAGQDSVTFTVQTHGVAKKTVVSVTGSVAGVNRNALVTLTTANLLNLTFTPPVIPGLGSTTGTVKLDGEAGSSFMVALTGLPAAYKYPASVTFNAGDTSKTFVVKTPYEVTQTDRTVTATRAASGGPDGYLSGTVTGTFTVTYVALKGVTVTPNPVDGGSTVKGTVELVQPAPAGGVLAYVSGTPAGIVTMPTTVTIPEGSTTADFDIQTPVLQNDTTVKIKAYRSGHDVVSTDLLIKSATIALTLNPNSVVGGQQNVTGTVTVQKAAGSGGLVVALTSSDTSAATVPASVTILAGQTSVDFTVTTKSVAINSDVTITGTLGSNSASDTLTVRAIGLLKIVFDSSSVHGGSVAPVTIYLDAPAPAGGLNVSLSATNNLFANLPPTVKVPAGATSLRLTSILTKRVSRDQVTVVTASTAGSQASASLRVTQAF